MKMHEPKMFHTDFDPSERARPDAEQNGKFYVKIADLTLRSCIDVALDALLYTLLRT